MIFKEVVLVESETSSFGILYFAIVFILGLCILISYSGIQNGPNIYLPRFYTRNFTMDNSEYD